MKVMTSLTYDKIAEIGIGEGRNSRVFQIRDNQLGANLVVKEIPKHNFPHAAKYFEEAQRLYSLEHQYILKIQYAAETPDTVCLVMPRASGGSLQQRLKNNSLSLTGALSVLHEVLSALAHAHQRGYAHLDLKPSNVLFDSQGRALLADFGQSASLNAVGVVTALPAMYMQFMPPEVITTGAAVVASDIYQAGFTLLRCLGGAPFFAPPPKGPMLEIDICNGKFPTRDLPPHVPDALARAVRKALEVDPGKRFQSATEFSDALTRIRIPLDWKLSWDPQGPVWRASRRGGTRLEVSRLDAGQGRYSIEAYTIGSVRRATAKTLWARDLTEKACYTKLRRLFKALE